MPSLARFALFQATYGEAVVKLVIVVVDDEADSLAVLVRELESRYGSHYRIVASGSAEDVFVRLGDQPRARRRCASTPLA